MRRRQTEDDEQQPSTSSSRPKRKTVRNGSNSDDERDEDYGTNRLQCRICNKEIPPELATELSRWWERLLVLAARYNQGRMSFEAVRKAYNNSEKIYAREVRGICMKYCFHMCKRHLAKIGKQWLDLLGIENSVDVNEADEVAVNGMIQMLNSIETKLKMTRKTFLCNLEQFLNYDWEKLEQLVGPLKEVNNDMTMVSDSEQNDEETEDEVEVGEEEEEESDEDDHIERTFEKQESFSSSGGSVAPSSSTKSSKSNDEMARIQKKKGRECKLCRDRVNGIDLSGDWSKQFVMFNAFKNEGMDLEECSTILGTGSRLYVCNRHVKDTAMMICEMFGVSNPIEFDTSYLKPETKQNVEEWSLEIHAAFDLRSTTAETFIKHARNFVYTHGKADPQVDEVPPIHKPSSSQPSSSSAPSKPKQSKCVVSPMPSPKVRNRKCHICEQIMPMQRLIILTGSFDVLCMLATLHFQHQWDVERIVTLYNTKIRLANGPRFFVCSTHYRESGIDLLTYLKIDDIDQADDVSYDETEPLRRLFRRIDRNLAIPADFQGFIRKCTEFVTKSRNRTPSAS